MNILVVGNALCTNLPIDYTPSGAEGAARTRHGMEQHARALHRYCELLYISSRFMAEGIVPDERQLSRTTRGEPRRA